MQVHFKFFYLQVVWKGAHLLGCGKTFINGEPYYIAQMDTPGVIAGVPGYDKSNVGEPKEVHCSFSTLGEGATLKLSRQTKKAKMFETIFYSDSANQTVKFSFFVRAT